MIEKLVVFLVRKKLGVKKYEEFRFANQKTNDIYFFTARRLKKKVYVGDSEDDYYNTRSTVSFNWLMDKECKIIIL